MKVEDRGVYSGDLTGYGLLCHLMLAQSRGRLTLTLPPDSARERVTIQLGHLEDPYDLGRLRQIVETAIRLGDDPAFAALAETLVQPTIEVASDRTLLERWIRDYCSTAHHLTSTCRMGTTADAVVDPAGRVHGLANLRVADASIMPISVRANTAAAAYAVGERMAEIVNEELGPASRSHASRAARRSRWRRTMGAPHPKN